MKNRLLLRVAFCVCLSLSLAMPIMAQLKVNPKFDKPANEELTMTTYAPDTSAAAVVLYESRCVRYNFVGIEFKLFTDVKCRIKVLKEEGKSWANTALVINYDKDDAHLRENVTKLKAASFNLENGKVVKTKMDGNMKSQEEIDSKHRLFKFTVPQVKVGSVIEYEYTLVSDYYFSIDDWNAQKNIPVFYTECVLIIPEYLRFNICTSGSYPFENTRNTASTAFQYAGTRSNVYSEEYTFKCHELPALKKERFVYNAGVYGQKVTAELKSIQFPGELFHSYATTWPQVDARLMDYDDFGGRLYKEVLKKELETAGIANLPTAEEKVNTIVKLLNSRVRWNKKFSIRGESASKALKDGIGNNATINFMLINMLNEVGVKAFPVVLRTRDDGFLLMTTPTVEQLSTVIVGYTDGDTKHFLDASMLQDGYIDVLPDIMLVNQAREVQKDGSGSWFDLQSAISTSQRQSIIATLSETGELTATKTAYITGLYASDLRERFREATDSVNFVNDLADELAVEITDYKLENHRSFSPKVTETISFTQQCDVSDGHIYLNPVIIPVLSENPFVAETRALPIDYPIRESQSQSINITLPEGYVVEELPQPVNIVSSDQSIRFKVQMTVNGRQLITRCTYKIDKLFFAAHEYPDMKAMYAEIAKHNTQMVVLKKVSE